MENAFDLNQKNLGSSEYISSLVGLYFPDNISIHSFKKNIEDQSDFNIINVEFDDFGSFVKRSSLSDSFLEGHGTATLYLKKLNLSLIVKKCRWHTH